MRKILRFTVFIGFFCPLIAYSYSVSEVADVGSTNVASSPTLPPSSDETIQAANAILLKGGSIESCAQAGRSHGWCEAERNALTPPQKLAQYFYVPPNKQASVSCFSKNCKDGDDKCQARCEAWANKQDYTKDGWQGGPKNFNRSGK